MATTAAVEASPLGRYKDAFFSVGLVAFAVGLMLILMGGFGLALHLPRPDLTGFPEILGVGLVVFIPGLILVALWALDGASTAGTTT